MRSSIAWLVVLLAAAPLLAAGATVLIVAVPDGKLPDWAKDDERFLKPDPPRAPGPDDKPVPSEVDPVSHPDVAAPPPCAGDDVRKSLDGKEGKPLGLFEEPKQLGFISWNGKEEVLAIKTDEKTATKGAYMSILPLPGKALKITQGNNKMWNKAENVMYDAFQVAGWTDAGSTPLGGVGFETKIGPHEICVWKADCFDDLLQKIETHVNQEYKGKAAPLVPDETRRVLESYIKDKGYRYFAIDIVDETGEENTKDTICYEFETPKGELYFPLVIGQGGGSGDTGVELLIVCNKEKLTIADDGAKVVLTGKFKNHFDKYARAKMTHDQAARIDPRFLKLFGDDEQLWGRWYTTKGDTDIRSFQDDVRLIEQK